MLVLGSAAMGIYCMGLVCFFYKIFPIMSPYTHARNPALTRCLCAHCVCMLFVTVTDSVSLCVYCINVVFDGY